MVGQKKGSKKPYFDSRFFHDTFGFQNRILNYKNVFSKWITNYEKSPTLCFMLGAIIRERLLSLLGFVCYCINLWFGFTKIYSEMRGGFPGHLRS